MPYRESKPAAQFNSQFTPKVMNNPFVRKYGTPPMDVTASLNKIQMPTCLGSDSAECTTQELIDTEILDNLYEDSSSECQVELSPSVFEQEQKAPPGLTLERDDANGPNFTDFKNGDNNHHQNMLFQQQLDLSQKMMENLRNTWITKFQEANEFNSDCWNAMNAQMNELRQKSLSSFDAIKLELRQINIKLNVVNAQPSPEAGRQNMEHTPPQDSLERPSNRDANQTGTQHGTDGRSTNGQGRSRDSAGRFLPIEDENNVTQNVNFENQLLPTPSGRPQLESQQFQGRGRHSSQHIHDNRTDNRHMEINYQTGQYNGSSRQNQNDQRFIENEARKKSFQLSNEPKSLPQFDPATESIGSFLVSRVFYFTEDHMLTKLEFIEPWLGSSLKTISPEKLRDAKLRARNNLSNTDQIRTYLVRLARILHGKNKPIHKNALRKNAQESVQMYCRRLVVEFETVARQRFDEFRSEQDLVSSVYYHITTEASSVIKREFAQAQTYLHKNVIDTYETLDKITESVDSCLIDEPEFTNGAIAAMSTNVTMRDDPYDKPIQQNSSSTKKCESCQLIFSPEADHHTMCRNCFFNNLLKSKTKHCLECKISFNPEEEFHKLCRTCFSKQNRSRSQSRNRDMNYSNNRNQSNNRYNGERDQRRPQPKHFEPKIQCISAPLIGTEYTVPSGNLTQDNIASALETFGVSANNKDKLHPHQRVFVKFNHESGEDGSALIDCGANVNTFTADECKKHGLVINEPSGTAPKVLDFEGRPCDTLGTVHTAIQIGKACFRGTFTVIKGSFGPGVILGTPFLSSYGLIELLKNRLSDITGPECVFTGNTKN